MHSPLGNYLDGPIRVGPVWKCSPSSTKNISIYTFIHHQTSLNTTDETLSAVPGLMLTLMLMDSNYFELLTSLDWCKLSYWWDCSLWENICARLVFQTSLHAHKPKLTQTHTRAHSNMLNTCCIYCLFVLLFHFLLLNCSFIYCCCASAYFSCLKLGLKWCLLGKSRWFFSLHRC